MHAIQLLTHTHAHTHTHLEGSRRASQEAAPSCLMSTTIAVMLSQPTPRAALGSAARHASSSEQAASVGEALASSLLLMKSTASWLVITSHTPSHASRKKRSAGWGQSSATRGRAVEGSSAAKDTHTRQTGHGEGVWCGSGRCGAGVAAVASLAGAVPSGPPAVLACPSPNATSTHRRLQNPPH